MAPGLGDEVRAWVARGGALDPNHIESLRHTAPPGSLLAAALDVPHRPREEIRQRIEDRGRNLVHRTGRHLNTPRPIARDGPPSARFSNAPAHGGRGQRGTCEVD